MITRTVVEWWYLLACIACAMLAAHDLWKARRGARTASPAPRRSPGRADARRDAGE